MAPPGSFSWTSFLLGFAIGLWLALVLLIILPDDDAPAATCPSCCCQGPVWPPHIPDWPLYIPDGNEPYTCANNDNGGGVVQDNGGGVVQDNGGGTVQDSVPKVPAPTDDTLGVGDQRGRFEFQCDTHDNGGGVVQDSGSARLVVVPMRKDDDLYCAEILGHAWVLKEDGADFILLRYDSNGDPEELGSPADVSDKVQYPSAETGDSWAFCTVAPDDDSNPAIVDADNQCIAKLGGCP